jgi:NAD+ kinase
VVRSAADVEIALSRIRLPLAQKRDYRHFAVLRTKLKWNGGLTP